MAIKRIAIKTNTFLSVCNCQEVVVCLPEDPWAGRVLTGHPFVFGEISGGRPLGAAGYENFAYYYNARCEAQYEYIFVYDDAQLAIDPATQAPYEIPCDVSIFPDTCVVSGLTAVSSPSKLIDHEAHGLGSAGDLVPVKPSATEGEYELAAYADDADVASFVAQVVDADSYRILGNGFHALAGHGYTVGSWYSGTAPGVFALSSSLTDDDYIQNAFTPVADNCIYVNLEEAQPPCSCCAKYLPVGGDTILRDALNDVGTYGPLAVTPDGAAASGYRPATAEDLAANGPIFIVTKTIDTDEDGNVDGFGIALNGCIFSDVLTPSTCYAVVPDSQVAAEQPAGSLVPASSVDTGGGDPLVIAGATSAEGCLHVNIVCS